MLYINVYIWRLGIFIIGLRKGAKVSRGHIEIYIGARYLNFGKGRSVFAGVRNVLYERGINVCSRVWNVL